MDGAASKKNGAERGQALRLGYLIPEFPGQTHIWMWREIAWMLEWAESVHVYSTRPPPERDRARHAFVQAAREITTYLWPLPSPKPIFWAIARHPGGVVRCVELCARLPIQKRWRVVHLLKLLPSACFLAKDITDRRISHLHSHSCANAAVLAMMAKRITGVGFSLTLNANIEWWGGAMREKFGEADFTIAITDWLLAQMRADFPELGPEQALLGRIGVDTTTWTAEERPPRADEVFRLVTVGRLHPSKGHDVLVRAVETLVREGRKVALRVVGDGPQRGDLEEQVAAAGLSAKVTFSGSLGEHEVRSELAAAHAFVLASHAEPLGVVYMEAMAAGLPAIGTNAGGVGEIITHRHDGLLVAPNDVDALAAAIRELMDDPALAQRLARNGRDTIVRRFDSRFGAATLFERITGKRPVQKQSVGSGLGQNHAHSH